MIRLILMTIALVLSAPAAANWFSDLKNIVFKNDTGHATDAHITDSNIAAALKQTLINGSDSVVSQLSAAGGFNDDLNIRIELPDELQTVQKALNKVGLSGSLDNLEDKLNGAAELATAKAKPLFVDAIQALTWSDVHAILNGPDDAATNYFKHKMAEPLSSEIKPVVDASLNEVDAVRIYNNLMESYSAMPFVPQVEADLSTHVTRKSIEGIFYYLALEEKSIRNDPAKHTTELLKKVFTR